MITMFFKKPLFSLTCFIIVFFLACVSITSAIHRYEAVAGYGGSSTVVRKDERQILVSTEFGQISAVNVSDGIGGQYHLQFITLEPNALFLPVILHADMVFYVHTGSGSLSWLEVEADNTNNLDLERGDVYGLPAGSIFYLQSSLEPERQKLRIYAMFVNSNEAAFQEPVLPMGTYSSIQDLLLGFDKKVLQSAFQVSAEAIEELMSSERQPPIVHSVVSKREEEEKEEKKKKKKKGGKQLIESRFMEAVMGSRSYRMLFNFNEETMNKKGKGKKKKKKTSTFNFMNADPDFQNCNGWSLAVTSNNLQALSSPDIGLFMVNLTRGAMMGPHWNPMAMELGIVTHGQGMVLTVSSSHGEIKSDRVKVEEGDIFVVPRFQMMAQLAFNNDSFVFMGFSTTSRMNHPQYMAGKASVLQVLDRKVLAMSFNVTNSTMDQILNPAVESIILECGSCAEEEERIMNEEIRKEEDRKREEEEAKKREEEEAAAARKREEEEAAARKKEEEEEAARKKEEEEEMRKREEEEARKRKEEEEEARKREEEEAKKREEEEEAKKREEEEAKKREEEEAKKREEEEAKKREEEEEARKRKEEEEAKWEEEEARKREKEQEEAQRRKEEEEVRKREEEEAIRRKEEEEEEAKREEEEARKREKEQEEAQRRKEEEAKKREEEEETKQEEEEARQSEKEQEEEAQRVREEAIRRIEEEKAKREQEKEEARKKEEEEQQEEEAKQGEEEEEWKGEGEGETA